MNELHVSKSLISSAIAVVPSNSAVLTKASMGLFVGVEGDLKVLLVGDTVPVIFKNISGGMGLMVQRVYATGTTATDILALY
jgi:hypothetical protein